MTHDPASVHRLAGRFLICEQKDNTPEIECWVKVIEQVLDKETGRVFETITDAPIFNGEDGPLTWYWEEGNMACDCNRGQVFGVDINCTLNENRFLLNLLNAMDRSVLYHEFDPPNVEVDRAKPAGDSR